MVNYSTIKLLKREIKRKQIDDQYQKFTNYFEFQDEKIGKLYQINKFK